MSNPFASCAVEQPRRRLLPPARRDRMGSSFTPRHGTFEGETSASDPVVSLDQFPVALPDDLERATDLLGQRHLPGGLGPDYRHSLFPGLVLRRTGYSAAVG